MLEVNSFRDSSVLRKLFRGTRSFLNNRSALIFPQLGPVVTSNVLLYTASKSPTVEAFFIVSMSAFKALISSVRILSHVEGTGLEELIRYKRF